MVFGEVVAVHIHTALILDRIDQTASPRPILRAEGAADDTEIRPDAMFRMRHPD